MTLALAISLLNFEFLRELFCADSESLLLLANHVDVRVISTKYSNHSRVVASKLHQAKACDFVYSDDLVFWIDAEDYKKVIFLISVVVAVKNA